jgi:hypothetical protein
MKHAAQNERRKKRMEVSGRWVQQVINMDVKVTSDKAFMWGSSSRCKKVMKIIEKYRDWRRVG